MSEDPSNSGRPVYHKPVESKNLAKDRAKSLRHDLSVPERIVWSKLRRGQLGGFKFRRQHPLGPYITDFYCHEAALVVEIDDVGHSLTREYDRQRDRWMTERGVAVLRFSTSVVSRDVDWILRRILEVAMERSGRAPHFKM